MNRVETPAAWACAAIAATLPPLERLRYQIHMPWPSNTLGLLPGPGRLVLGRGGPIAWANT